MRYYYLCKTCEHLFHCFGREIAEEIENDDLDEYLIPGLCNNYYSEL